MITKEEKRNLARECGLEAWQRLCADPEFFAALHADGAEIESVAILAEAKILEWATR